VRCARADGAECVVVTNTNRRGVRRSGPIAELTVVILAPAPRNAATRDRAAVRQARGDGREAQVSADACRR